MPIYRAVVIRSHNDSVGTALNFDVLSDTVSTVRKAKSMGCSREVMAEELEPIREDYEKRHKGK